MKEGEKLLPGRKNYQDSKEIHAYFLQLLELPVMSTVWLIFYNVIFNATEVKDTPARDFNLRFFFTKRTPLPPRYKPKFFLNV
jgi:hypothetical protein